MLVSKILIDVLQLGLGEKTLENKAQKHPNTRKAPDLCQGLSIIFTVLEKQAISIALLFAMLHLNLQLP